MRPVDFPKAANGLKGLVGDVSDLPDAPYVYSQRAPSDRRALKNEADRLDALGPRFKVVRPDQLDFATQIGVFSKAKCVVGVHGSNLTNIVFCPDGTGVVELFAGQPQKMYAAMAEAGAMPFQRVEGQLQPEPADTHDELHWDFTVNPAEVQEAVERVLSP